MVKQLASWTLDEAGLFYALGQDIYFSIAPPTSDLLLGRVSKVDSIPFKEGGRDSNFSSCFV